MVNGLILGFLCSVPLLQLFKLKSWVVSAVISMLLTSVVVSLLTDFHQITAAISILTLLAASALMQQPKLRFGHLLALNGLLFTHIFAAYMPSTAAGVILTVFILFSLIIALLKNQPWLNWLLLLVLALTWLLFAAPTLWLVSATLFALFLLKQATSPNQQPGAQATAEQTLTQIEAIKSEERSRIYKNIHDDVGAELLKLIYELDNDKHRERAKTIMNQLRKAVAQTEHIQINLLQLLEAITSEIQSRCDAAQITYIEQLNTQDNIRLEPALPIQIQRMVREVVSNCLKHAQANTLTFTADLNNQALLLTIIDDGIGMDPQGQSGKGLKSLQQRAAAIGAVVRWQTSPAGGTEVFLTVPVQ